MARLDLGKAMAGLGAKMVADSRERNRMPHRYIRICVRACGIGVCRDFVISPSTLRHTAELPATIERFAKAVRRRGVEVEIVRFTRTDVYED